MGPEQVAFAMRFLDTVARAKTYLHEHGRVSLRALKREFELDEEALDELIEELVEIQQIAVRDGRALARAGSGPPAPTGVLEPDRAPRDYTPKHLADKILQSKSAIEGERKQVTVLFADVKGSTELAEGLDPEEWHGISDRFLQILLDGVHRLEGTVNQFLGDGVMALFGAPIAHEDHAQRACHAALQLRDALKRYGDEVKRAKGVPLAFRMGLNSGEVVVGKIGDDLRMDYTAAGFTTNLAARMQKLADPGTVFLSESTRRLVEGYFELRDLGAFEVPGVGEPVRVAELQAAGPLRTRLDSSRSRGFSRFVGRGGEMATLQAALDRSREGQGQVVGVVGEAGVGKSRLCLEFVENCRAAGISVHEAQCPAHGKTMPLLRMRQLLRNLFEISGEDPERLARDKIAGQLLMLDEGFREIFPLLFDFLGVPDREHPTPRIDPEARQRRLFAFLHQLLRTRSEREAAVFLVDDLHWIDAASDAFLAQLGEAVGGTRTLLLVTFRPEYRAEWIGKFYHQKLPLAPLGAEAIDELLRVLLGDDPSVVALADRIRQRTGGNPFFIEEMVHSLRESGSLEGRQGSYRLVKPIAEEEIPASVQVVLAARIDRLPEREKGVLQTAAVIGRTFSEGVLARVSGLSPPDLMTSLSHLRDADFIREESLYPENKYAFKHALARGAAYESQLGVSRRRTHSAVAAALAEEPGGDLDENAGLLAQHWEAAGDAAAAVRSYWRAALWARDVADPDATAAYARTVLALLEHSPRGEEHDQLGISACILIIAWAGTQGGLGETEARAVLEKGRAFGRAQLAPLAVLLSSYGTYREVTAGAAEECFEHVSAAVETADRSGSDGARWLTRSHLAYAHWHEGRLEDALRIADEAVEVVTGAAASPMLAHPRPFVARGFALSKLGRYSDARADLEHAVALGRAQSDHYSLSMAYHTLVELHGLTGDAQTAMCDAEAGLECAEKAGSVLEQAFAQYAFGTASIMSGLWPSAVRALEKAADMGRRGASDLLPGMLGALAEAHLGSGSAAAAEEAVNEVERAIQRLQGAWDATPAELSVARVCRRLGGARRIERARRAVERMAPLLEGGARCYLAPTLVERAALAAIDGDEETSRAELREAHRLYTEMGATGHAERLARVLNS